MHGECYGSIHEGLCFLWPQFDLNVPESMEGEGWRPMIESFSGRYEAVGVYCRA